METGDVSEADDKRVPAPSIWPIGFAIGFAVLLIGLVISTAIAIVGAVVAAGFALLWILDAQGKGPSGEVKPHAALADAHDEPETYGRAFFLTAATVGLGGVIGAGVTLPSLGFGVLPSFLGENVETNEVDLGPISNFPEGEYIIATFRENDAFGDVSRRTAYIRNNGFTEDTGEPSFTTIFSRCVHLGCPVQPNGPIDEEATKEIDGVELRPVLAASFGCPCHGGLYDAEGNRTAGPPVRALDRYEFSIKNGNLVLGKLYSVGVVDGTGAKAKIQKYRRAYPGVHVDGVSSWLYPIPTPGS